MALKILNFWPARMSDEACFFYSGGGPTLVLVYNGDALAGRLQRPQNSYFLVYIILALIFDSGSNLRL
jgi:hypothetical protein